MGTKLFLFLPCSKLKNFDKHETRIIFLRARPLKKKKIFAYNKRFLSVMSRTSNAIQNLSEATKSQEREKERGLSQHPVVCYFWPGNCGEVTSACSRFQNRGTKGRHENMTLVGAALLFAKLLMLHASLSLSPVPPSLPPFSLFPCVFAGAVITGTITCCAACLM